MEITTCHHAAATSIRPGRQRARQLTWQTGRRARRAKRQLLLLVPLTAGTLAAYVWREELFGTDAPVTREGDTQERVLRRTADGGSEDRSIDGDPERERDVPDRGMRVSEEDEDTPDRGLRNAGARGAE